MIEVESLSKTFHDRKRGPVSAVSDVTFACRPGEVYGLLGPNGAGKTTTLRMISTALRPTGGRARVMGHDVLTHPIEVRRSIGFLSANTGLYGRLTPRETLHYFGKLFGMGNGKLQSRIDSLAEIFGMTSFLDRPCDKLSTGMRQKVNIARTVLHDPPVMVFDEPSSGLDVLTSRTIVQFIRECKEQGKIVLFSTHIMAEVEKLCDHVGMIHQGRLAFSGTLAELRDQFGDEIDEAFIRIIGEAA